METNHISNGKLQTGLIICVVIGAGVGGYFLYKHYKKTNQVEDDIPEDEDHVEEIEDGPFVRDKPSFDMSSLSDVEKDVINYTKFYNHHRTENVTPPEGGPHNVFSSEGNNIIKNIIENSDNEVDTLPDGTKIFTDTNAVDDPDGVYADATMEIQDEEDDEEGEENDLDPEPEDDDYKYGSFEDKPPLENFQNKQYDSEDGITVINSQEYTKGTFGDNYDRMELKYFANEEVFAPECNTVPVAHPVTIFGYNALQKLKDTHRTVFVKNDITLTLYRIVYTKEPFIQ